MLTVHNLTFNYHKKPPVLNNISLEILPGEIVNILGPNGCGKTTLLKAILGFLPVPPNCLYLDGRPLEKIKRNELAKLLAYVPQSHHGVFHYTAEEVILMGRTVHSPLLRFSKEDYRQASLALEKVKMSHLAQCSYLELSGGERQLILIARALAQDCAYLIMDEPVGGLDYGNQFHFLDLIGELAATGLTVILTTHHPEQAVYLGGRALLMRQGQLIADGLSKEIITHENVRTLYGLAADTLHRIHAIKTGH